MTHPASLPAPPDRLTHAPAELAAYRGLRTDHYPWTEVNTDLNLRQSQDFSGLLDAAQDTRWARFVWVRGVLVGGYTRGAQEVTWASTMQALPRAEVSLYETPPAVAQLVWACRSARPSPLPGVWPDAAAGLERTLFSGLVVSAGATSYWQAGHAVAGTLPDAGASAQTLTPYSESDRAALIGLYGDVLGAVAQRVALAELWPSVVLRLSEEHPSLDPFSQEIVWRAGRLEVDPDVTVAELRAAMPAALRATLARAGLRLTDLNLRTDDPAWAWSGLEGL